MGPIHKGVTIGRRIAELERLAKKVKKKLQQATTVTNHGAFV